MAVTHFCTEVKFVLYFHTDPHIYKQIVILDYGNIHRREPAINLD